MRRGHQFRRTRGDDGRLASLLEGPDVQTLQTLDALMKGLGKVERSGHRPGRYLTDLLGLPCTLGEQVDGLGARDRRVDVTDDETGRLDSQGAMGMQDAGAGLGGEFAYLCHVALEGHGVLEDVSGPVTGVDAAHAGGVGPKKGAGGAEAGAIVTDEDDARTHHGTTVGGFRPVG